MSQLDYMRAEGFSNEEIVLAMALSPPSLLELATYPGFEWLLERYVSEMRPPPGAERQK